MLRAELADGLALVDLRVVHEEGVGHVGMHRAVVSQVQGQDGGELALLLHQVEGGSARPAAHEEHKPVVTAVSGGARLANIGIRVYHHISITALRWVVRALEGKAAGVAHLAAKALERHGVDVRVSELHAAHVALGQQLLISLISRNKKWPLLFV